MNKALEWYNNIKEGDKIGNITVEKCFTGHIDKQEALEDYIQGIKKRTHFNNAYSLWEMAEEQLDALQKEYGANGVIQLFKGNEFYDPCRPLKSKENLFMDENKAPHCINKKCHCNCYYKNFGGFANCSMAWNIAGCITNELCNLLIVYYIGGWSGIKAYEKESKDYLNSEIFRYIEKTWDKNYIGVEETNLYNTLDNIFKCEEDLIVVSKKELKNKRPFLMDKWEIMNMLENKARDSEVFKITENHYKIIFEEEDEEDREYHFICPISARQEVKNWWKEIRWILNNLFITKFEKEERLFY